MTDPIRALKEQLATLRQTACYLLEQAAAHGGEVHLPPESRHRLDATRNGIQQCKNALRAFGVVVDDGPEDTMTIAASMKVRAETGGALWQWAGFNFDISPALGNAVSRTILQEDSLLSKLVVEVVELLKGSAATKRTQDTEDRRAAAVAEQLAQKIHLLLDESDLPTDQRAVVVQELEHTLSDAQIDVTLLLNCALDPQRLAERLAKCHLESRFYLSETAARLYHRALEIAAIDLVTLANEMDSFQRLAWARDFQSQEQILNYLAELHAHPATEAAAFLGDYRAALCDTYDRLELFGIPAINDVIRRQQLSITYITLEAELVKVEQRRTQANKEVPLLKQMLEQHNVPDYTKSGPVEQVIMYRRRVVLSGEAGAGKTTLLRWLAVRAATRSFPALLAGWNDCVPFLIPLRKWANEGFPSLDQFLGDLERTLGQPPQGWVREQFRSGRALLLIDGVDELPQASRATMLEGVSRLVAQYPLPRYIVTSRPLAVSAREWPEWVEWAETANFSTMTLRDMDQTSRELLIDRWYAAVAHGLMNPEEQAKLPEFSGNLKRLLQTQLALQHLTTNPFLCAILCVLHRENGQKLPNQRFEFYQQCVKMLLYQRDNACKVPSRDDFPKLSDAQMLWLISDFALSLRLAGKLAVDVQYADAFFSDRLQEIGEHNQEFGKALRLLFIERSNLLHEPSEGQIEFRHRAFHDYLTALALVNQNAIGVLLKHAADEQWHDIIVLAAGLTKHAHTDRLLRGLLSQNMRLKLANRLRLRRDRTQCYRLNVLALSCVEVARMLSPNVRDAVIKEGLALFSLESLNNLVELYQVQEDYERALPLYEQALAIFERVLGSNHPSTVQIRNSLAHFQLSFPRTH